MQGLVMPQPQPPAASAAATMAAEQQRAAMNSLFEQQRNKAAMMHQANPQPVASTSAVYGAQALHQQAQRGGQTFDFLPGGLAVGQLFTRVNPLRKTDKLPEISKDDQDKIKTWVAKDHAYEELLTHDRRLAKQAIDNNTVDWMKRSDWLGNTPNNQAGTAWAHAAPGGAFRVQMPEQRNKMLAAGKRKSRVETLMPRKKLKPEVAASFTDEEETLVPIRLEFEHEAQKVRDVFTWNMRDAQVTPEVFVRTLCEDLMLPTVPFQRELVSQINNQLEDARRSAFRDNVFPRRTDDELHEDEYHDDVDDDFWRQWRRRTRDKSAGKAKQAELQYTTSLPTSYEELRIVVKLDITFGLWHLVDQFEWDIADQHNSAELFAKSYAADLGLPGDFVTAISHSIREQSEQFAKSLEKIEHQPGNPVVHEELRSGFLHFVTEPIRAESSEISRFTPYLMELTVDDLERGEKERDREFRRKRRQTRGRQNDKLPDREALKTHRTLMPKPGAVPEQARMDEDNETTLVPALPVAQPFEIVRRLANKPKPVPMLQEESPDLKPKPGPKVKRGRGRPPNSERMRALSQTPAAPGGAPKAESPGATPPLELPPSETATPLRKPGRKAGGSSKKRNRYGSPTAEELATQRDNYIDGVWHCANCGGPEGVVTGRRLGPKGKDTLCGECGKYYHRNRKSRPCGYNTSAEHHIALRQAEQAARQAAQAVNRDNTAFTAPHSGSSDSDDSDDEPIRRTRRPPQRDTDYIDTPTSPDSRQAAPKPAPAPAPPPSQPATSSTQHRHAGGKPVVPPWMLAAAATLRHIKPDDRFDIIPRPRPPGDTSGLLEWRIRCSDCPGKLYTPGPNETLENFAIHLKNRAHRANVEARLGRGPPPAAPAAAGAS